MCLAPLAPVPDLNRSYVRPWPPALPRSCAWQRCSQRCCRSRCFCCFREEVWMTACPAASLEHKYCPISGSGVQRRVRGQFRIHFPVCPQPGGEVQKLRVHSSRQAICEVLLQLLMKSPSLPQANKVGDVTSLIPQQSSLRSNQNQYLSSICLGLESVSGRIMHTNPCTLWSTAHC